MEPARPLIRSARQADLSVAGGARAYRTDALGAVSGGLVRRWHLVAARIYGGLLGGVRSLGTRRRGLFRNAVLAPAKKTSGKTKGCEVLHHQLAKVLSGLNAAMNRIPFTYRPRMANTSM